MSLNSYITIRIKEQGSYCFTMQIACQTNICLKGQKALRAFSLGKLQEKLNAHFSTINICANDPRLLEKDTAFNVVNGLNMS